MFSKLKKMLKSKKAVGSVATAIKVGTACVLGATMLVGGVALTNDVVLPNNEAKVANVASYEGGGDIGGGSVGGVTPVSVTPVEPTFQDIFDEATSDITETPEEFYYGDFKYLYDETWDVYNVMLNTTETGSNYGFDYSAVVSPKSTYSEMLSTAFGIKIGSWVGNTFENDTTIESFSINTNIDEKMFKNCTSLENINIGDNVKSIARYAFYGCTNLTNVNIPSSVSYIGQFAFQNSGLTSITLPNVSDCEQAFYNCSYLTTVYVTDTTATSFNEYDVFSNCTALEKVYLPANITSMGAHNFWNCSAISDVYYKGQQSNITVHTDNAYMDKFLKNATWHYGYDW